MLVCSFFFVVWPTIFYLPPISVVRDNLLTKRRSFDFGFGFAGLVFFMKKGGDGNGRENEGMK